MDEYVLIGAAPGRTETVVDWLRDVQGVRDVRVVRYGSFDVLARVEGETHLDIVQLITNTLRFHEGVERVRELGDADEAEGVLQAVRSLDPSS